MLELEQCTLACNTHGVDTSYSLAALTLYWEFHTNISWSLTEIAAGLPSSDNTSSSLSDSVSGDEELGK